MHPVRPKDAWPKAIQTWVFNPREIGVEPMGPIRPSRPPRPRRTGRRAVAHSRYNLAIVLPETDAELLQIINAPIAPEARQERDALIAERSRRELTEEEEATLRR